MFEYKFEKLELKTGFWQMKPSRDYHAIIKKRADEGWRFLQVFAPAMSAHPNPSYLELIFERAKSPG